MAQTIELHSKKLGKDYIFEFTRKVLLDTEKIGLGITKDDVEFPYNSLLKIMQIGLYLHHGVVEMKEVAEIFNEVDDLDSFAVALQNLYASTFKTLTDEKGNTKKANWVVK